MYDPVYVEHFFLFALFGGLTGWGANYFDKGSGLGRFWDIVAGILGTFLGASLAYVWKVEGNGFGAVLGGAFLGSVVFLALLWLFSLRWRQGQKPND